MLMRRLHRWFGLVTAVILLAIATTGVVRDVWDITVGVENTGPTPDMLLKMLENEEAAKNARSHPGTKPLLSAGDDHPSFGRQVNLIHDGERFGVVGKILSLIGGVALLVFAVTGLFMYLTMFNSRRRIGKHGFFW